MRRAVLVMAVAALVCVGSAAAWSAVSQTPGIPLCLPAEGGQVTTPKAGRCAKNSTLVHVADLAGVQALEQRVAALEGGPTVSAAATEVRIPTGNWGSPGCQQNGGVWVFGNCSTDPSSVDTYVGNTATEAYGLRLDGSRYPSATAWSFRYRFSTQAAASGEICLRLFDATTNAPVELSESCTSVVEGQRVAGVRALTSPFALPLADHDYLLQTKMDVVCTPSGGFTFCNRLGQISGMELIGRW